MRFEGRPQILRSKAEASGNGTESVEDVSGAIHFESLGELKKKLVPWMREMRLEKVSVYAYEGQTDREVGHFIVTKEENRVTMEDGAGNTLSLFGGARPTIGRASAASRSVRGRQMRIEQWLTQNNVAPHTSSFDAFLYEEGDEEQTEQEAAAEAGIVAETPVDAEVAPEPTVEPVPPTEPVPQKKVKGPRRPKRRKPVKAERKARMAEGMRQEYTTILSSAMESVHAMNMKDPTSHLRAHEAFGKLSQFLQANPELKMGFKDSLENDPAYAELRVLLSTYSNPARIPSGMRLSGAGRYVRRLAQEMHGEAFHDDPFRSHHAMHWFGYETERTIDDYTVLFPDKLGEELFDYWHSRGKERWLDIGSGETYRVPTSLMNTIGDINPNVSIVGLDPLYAAETAATADKLQGRHRLDPEWAAKNELVPGTAQNMKFPDASFDQVLSFFAFDKFNESIGGTHQALRQVARVLKPGGHARIVGLDLSALKEPAVLETFFEVKFTVVVPIEQTDVGKSFAMVVLERKSTDEESERKLHTDIEDWLDRYASGPTAK